MYIDTHCHLTSDQYDDLHQQLKAVSDHIIIISGVNQQTNEEVLKLCDQYTHVYGTLGIHPEAVHSYTKKDIQYIKDNCGHPKIVAIGEVGLDYYWTKDTKEEQKSLFKEQILMAKEVNLPLVIHSREASEDTYQLLKDMDIKKIGGVLHCYSGSLEMAKQYLTLGLRFGIGGVVTFKNSRILTEVVKELPLEAMVLETDSPFLAPEPVRGTKNTPKNVVHVAKKIAQIKEVPLKIIEEQTTINACHQFDLKCDLC